VIPEKTARSPEVPREISNNKELTERRVNTQELVSIAQSDVYLPY
jgi:hypothetical protein